MNLSFREERMSDVFVKYHIDGLPFPAVLHHFTGPDHGDPHDHPWGFTSHVLSGGYVEERYGPDGAVETVERAPGSSHRVEATDVHRMVALPAGECLTLALPSPHERETRFWRFDGGKARSRLWHSDQWK